MQSLPRSRFRACISNREISLGFVFFSCSGIVMYVLQSLRLSRSLHQLRVSLYTFSALAYAGFKRPPLPPQSARFREMSKCTPPESESISTLPHAVQAPLTRKDGGMMPIPTNVDSSLLSGPRSQPQIVSSAGCQSYQSLQRHKVPAIYIFGHQQ
jgi:hypothetical protein